MVYKFKALGLALVAVFAISAFVVSAASATGFTATNGNYPVHFSGSQPGSDAHLLSIDGHGVACVVAEFSGTLTAVSTTATVTPTYDSCSMLPIGATITMNGCDYLFHLPASGGNATVDLVCPGGKDVTIDASSCVIHIPPFTGKGHVNMSNNGAHIDADPTVSGITANLTDGFLCPFEGNTHTTNGTLTGGAVTLEGEGEGIDIG